MTGIVGGVTSGATGVSTTGVVTGGKTDGILGTMTGGKTTGGTTGAKKEPPLPLDGGLGLARRLKVTAPF